MSYDDLMAELERIDPVLRANAAGGERTGRLPRQTLDALFGCEAFKVWVPKGASGAEMTVPEGMQVFERVSRSDGATGWCVMIGAGAGWFGGFLEPHVAKEILGGREDVIAGSGAPRGRATPVKGGYRVSGRWKYASGAPHASWFTANCVIEEESTGGEPQIRAVAVPRKQVEIIETWDVHGMRATGSHDIAVDDVFVPQKHTFSVFGDEPHVQEALYRVPFIDLAAASFGPVALGIAARALEEFGSLAEVKQPSGGTSKLIELPGIRQRYAEAQTIVSAARIYLYEVVEAAWKATVDGEEEQVPGASQAARHAVVSAARAVDMLYEVSGMDVLYQESALGRCWRDVHAVTQNVAVSALQPLFDT